MSGMYCVARGSKSGSLDAEGGGILVHEADEPLGQRPIGSFVFRCARLMILSSISVMLRT